MTGDRLAGEFKQLERAAGGSSADYQLLQLKQRMGVLPAGAAAPSRQLGAGDGGSAPEPANAPQLPASTSQPTGEAELIAEIEQLRGRSE